MRPHFAILKVVETPLGVVVKALNYDPARTFGPFATYAHAARLVHLLGLTSKLDPAVAQFLPHPARAERAP